MAGTRGTGQSAADYSPDTVLDVEPAAAMALEGELVTRPAAGETGAKAASSAPASSRYMWFIIAGALAVLFWVAAVLAFSAGQNGLAGLMALPGTGMASLLFVTIGPAVFIMLATVLIAEMVRFRRTARYIGALAERFADPARATREDARQMAEAVHSEISRVNKAVEGALARLGAMEEVLGHHSRAIHETEAQTRERTDALINDLRREREAVADLAIVLDQKAADIAEAITEQSKMVVAAADIANANAQESSKTLRESSSLLTSAVSAATTDAGQVADRLDEASSRLGASTSTLGEAGEVLKVSARELEQIRQKARDSFAASSEDARALSELTRQNAEQAQSIAQSGAETINKAFDAVLGKARDGVQAVQEETRQAAHMNARQAAELKAASEEARSALEAFAEVIAKRLEQANEASFSAARWADKTFERLESATRSLEEKLSALPEAADVQVRDMQEKLQKGLAGLNATARSAADEAEEIDAAFQTRIRQNYELLSDFMLRMGAAADQRGGPMSVPSPFGIEVRSKEQTPAKKAAPPTLDSPAPENQSPQSIAAPDEPSKTPEESATMRFAKAQIKAQKETRDEPAAASRSDATAQETKAPGWSWKDVLSGMDRAGTDRAGMDRSREPATLKTPETPPSSDEDPLGRLVTLFRIHEIDPAALFGAQVYRALAHARLVGGEQAMRDIVRMEAAKETSALVRSFAEDGSLRRAGRDFIAALDNKINAACEDGNRAHLETRLRTGDGPAWLLIKAALG